jgi:DNA-binding transcriptional ArsR family regulator
MTPEKSKPLEDVFSSKVRIKIFKLLMDLGQFNASKIAEILGINYETAAQHLEILENETILIQRKYGRRRLYRLNENSPKARAIIRVIEEWKFK